MFWENFVELCSQRGTSPNAVAAELGKSSGSVTAWKNGAVPRETTLKKIAEHFSVTVDRLVYGQKEKPTEIISELSPVKQDAWNLIQMMDDNTLSKFIAMAKIALGGTESE